MPVGRPDARIAESPSICDTILHRARADEAFALTAESSENSGRAEQFCNAVSHASRLRALIAVLVALPVVTGCRTQQNYITVDGPRFIGAPAAPSPAQIRLPDTVRIVSFNIAFSVGIDSAIVTLSRDPSLNRADILLLQEMDETGTRRIADAFGMWYVYYPATLHLTTKRPFGNAILSRWQIVEDSKLVLPNVSLFGRTQRTATAATIRFGDSLVRVYSTHLGTLFDITSGARRAQLRAILADASKYSIVIIGGDMNSGSVGRVARAMGYAWPTERGPWTTRGGRWDHIYLKGLTVPDSAGAGTVLDVRGSSDHGAVWATAVIK